MFNGAPSWISFFLDGTYPAYFPAGMVVGAHSSLHPVVYPPLNRAVFVACGDNTKTTIRWNNATQTNISQTVATLSSGGTIGINSAMVSQGSEWGYCGVVYRIMVYRQAHTTAQMDAQVAELASLYGVLTNYMKQAVCVGDSIVEGVASTNLQAFPFQLWQRYPEIKWRNQGIGGLLIGSNNVAGSMYVIDGNFVDPLYETNLQQNWLFFFGGVNDINNGINPLGTYARLTNYVASRKAARPWQVCVSTVHSDTVNPGSNAMFNAYIRTNSGGWDRYIDPGVNSPIETRLNHPTNLTYFATDGLHLVNAGYGVLADHFGQIINVPHRSTGFLGP
jgi:lysophospholipase L1-like esterase